MLIRTDPEREYFNKMKAFVVSLLWWGFHFLRLGRNLPDQSCSDQFYTPAGNPISHHIRGTHCLHHDLNQLEPSTWNKRRKLWGQIHTSFILIYIQPAIFEERQWNAHPCMTDKQDQFSQVPLHSSHSKQTQNSSWLLFIWSLLFLYCWEFFDTSSNVRTKMIIFDPDGNTSWNYYMEGFCNWPFYLKSHITWWGAIHITLQQLLANSGGRKVPSTGDCSRLVVTTL